MMGYRLNDTPFASGISNMQVFVCRYDADSKDDGFSELEESDNTDPSIYPFASDPYGNCDGIDSDCDDLDCEVDVVIASDA